jgi:hypothetical protein
MIKELEEVNGVLGKTKPVRTGGITPYPRI